MFAAGSGDFGVGVFGSMVTNRITSCGSDPEPSFQFNVDPDLTIHFNVDLDPAPHHSDDESATTDPSRLHFEPPRLHFEPLKLQNFDFNTDPDLALRSNADPYQMRIRNPVGKCCVRMKLSFFSLFMLTDSDMLM
jgi:hypothetical protein